MKNEILNKFYLGRVVKSRITDSLGYISAIAVDPQGRIRFSINWKGDKQSILYIDEDSEIIENNLDICT